jgi:hypothetical protein
MTLKELMNGAAQACIDTREAHVIMFTEGLNGYVCPNEGVLAESRAVFKGTYRDCQIWVERRGISAALRYVMEHRAEVPELSAGGLTAEECLELISRLTADRSGS